MLLPMATPPKKKAAKRAKAKSRPSQTQKIGLLQRELADALEQQRAASEILRMIRTSSTGLQPVLDAIAESAARLCDSYDAQIFRLENNVITRVASYGPLLLALERTPLNRQFPVGRAMVDRQAVHIHDLAADIDAEYPEVKGYQQKIGHRTTLAVPFLQDGSPIGAILIRRLEVRPFTEPQIKLLETFADQAVIAIENARLIHEQQARNRDLTEALEQQTATSEILRVIASSPADIQPMLDTIAESAARLCESYDAVIQRVDGDFLFRAAHFGPVPVGEIRPIPLTRELPSGRAIVDRQTVHVDDVSLEIETEYRDVAEIQKRSGSRTVLATPLLSRGVPIGVIMVRRMEVQPFSDKQIKLLETFADQAVIAIENARLFQEFKESLEQQTATSEILGIIASSPTDIQPVLDTIAKNAARLCEATNAQVFRFDGDVLRLVANHGGVPSSTEAPIRRGSPLGRIFVDRKTLHVHDLAAELETEFPDAKASQQRLRSSNHPRHAAAARGRSDRCDWHSPNGGPAFYR